MRETRTLFASVWLLCLGSVGLCASAQDGTVASSTNTPPLSAELRHQEGPGLLPADHAILSFGTNKFAFLIPAGYKLETWSDNTAALVTRDYDCQITFKMTSLIVSDEETNQLAGHIMAEHSGARLMGEYSAIADGHRGPAFNVEVPGVGSSWKRGQIAFIPWKARTLEFSLICSPEKFEKARQQFNTVLLTFRIADEKGELHITPLSDKL